MLWGNFLLLEGTIFFAFLNKGGLPKVSNADFWKAPFFHDVVEESICIRLTSPIHLIPPRWNKQWNMIMGICIRNAEADDDVIKKQRFLQG